METTVQLRFRQVDVQDIFLRNSLLLPATPFVIRSSVTGRFGRIRATNDPDLNLGELYIMALLGGIYIQQETTDDGSHISEGVSVPLRVALPQDLASAKAKFKRGLTYFVQRTNGTINNRIKRIAGDTAFGYIAQLVKESRLYVQESCFVAQIEIVNAAQTA